MIWFVVLVISLIFVIAINEAHLKSDKLCTEIKFLQADILVQEQVNNSLRQSLNVLLKLNTEKIINGSKMEHMGNHD